MAETRKIAAILVADVVGYSRLAGADEDRTLARLPFHSGHFILQPLSSTVPATSAPLTILVTLK